MSAYDESAKSAVIAASTAAVLPDSPEGLSGIIARYTFDETSGTTAADQSGKSGAAALNGGASWTAGRTGGAVKLDGTSGFVSLPQGIANYPTVTVAAWVKLDALKTWQRIFDFGTGTDKYFFITPQSSSGDTRFAISTGGSYNNEQVVKAAPARQATGKWVHYAVTLSGNTAILYVNGTEAARNESMTFKPSDLGATLQNYIGKSQFDPDPYLSGAIDDFYVFNRALSPAEIGVFTVKENTAAVEADKSALDLGDTSAVISDLTLPASGRNGSAITWQSSDPSVIDATGKVTRPAIGAGNAEVTLTATLKLGNVTQTRTFAVTVLEMVTDDKAVALDKAALAIPSEVSRSLSLPAAGPNGTTIGWQSSDTSFIRNDGTVTRPAKGAGDAHVTMTATIAKGEYSVTKTFDVTVLENEGFTGYLFAYFTADSETLHYAVSRDGLRWTALNGGNPVLFSTIGNRSIRDPHIIRGEDGTFHLVSTNPWSSTDIVVWDSTDLVNWSNQRLVKAAPDGSTLAWAPEAYYDKEAGTYVIVSSSDTADGTKRIFKVTTPDFVNFSAPSLLYDPGFDAIDATIVSDSGKQYLFFKDEREGGSTGKTIRRATADPLQGPYGDPSGSLTDNTVWSEGPAVFESMYGDKWYMYVDQYTQGTWALYTAADLSGSWTKVTSGYSMPARARHGTVLPMTEDDWNAVVNAYSTPVSTSVDVGTKAGQAPKLPKLVWTDYTNGLSANLPVNWDDVDPAKYAAPGTFTVGGTAAGSSARVQANVTVLDGSAKVDTIRNGEPWYDDTGGVIQAHGGHIIKVGDTYYWFGEDKAHNSAVFKGVSVYASKDLKNWEFRNSVLTTASSPELANSKVERPKVLYNQKTGKYVLWGHWEEGGNYNQANVVVAVSDTVDGDYTFVKRFQPGGNQSRDFTVFQDDDGTAYLISSANNNLDLNIYRLTDDYLNVEYLYTLFPGQRREAPAVIKKDGIYYLLTSGQSGWFPNQGMYATSASMTDKNAWSGLKLFGDPSTYYTQPANTLTVQGTGGTSYIYIGDRWNPNALGTSQYIWLPLELDNGTVTMNYEREWDINAATGLIEAPKSLLVSEGQPAKASSAASGFGAGNANDGNYGTYFDSGTGTYPVTWQVDLGRPHELSHIDISWREWNGSESAYQYKIEGSSDDSAYTLLADRTGNTTTSFTSDGLSGKYRFVKVTVVRQYNVHNNNNVDWYRGIHEVRVYSSDLTLDTPAGLTATTALIEGKSAATTVNLKWNAVSNAGAYTVYRSGSPDGDYEAVYTGRAAAYSDNDLSPDTTYYYKVKAVHAGGGSELSKAVSARTFIVPSDLRTYDNSKENVWTDEQGNPKHWPTITGDGFLKVGSTYYWYEYVSDSNGFKQLNVYTSQDGETWTFKQAVLTSASNPELSACKLEALNFTYNKSTGKVVIWMHYENNKDYSLGRAAVASGDPGGVLTFHGSLRPAGNDSRDITFFKDDDGTGYIISAGNTNADMFIYKLSPDYLTVEQQVAKVFEGKHREAPSMMKKDGIYYLFTSEAAGWYPSKGMYASAPSIEGPWSELRLIGNASTFSAQSGGTWNMKGTETASAFMMANRWIRNPGEAQQRWLPIAFHGGYVAYDYYERILYNPMTGVTVPVQDGILLSQGKPAFASDSAAGSSAGRANDGDYGTSWVSANNTWPKSWTVDLGDVYSLTNIQISWFLMNGSEGYHKYRIETSTDGVQYTTALDRTDNKTYGFTSDKLSGKARYVRVQLVDAVLWNNPNNWYTPQLGEVKVFGNPIVPVTSVTVAGTDGGSTINRLGGTLQMTAKVQPEEATDKSVVWSVYEKDGTTPTGKASIDSSGLLTAIEEGVVTVKATAADGYGAEGMALVTIDVTPPQSSADLTPAAPDGQNGWNLHPVTVRITAEDNLSGVAETVYSLDGADWRLYTGPIVLAQDGNYSVSYRSTDLTGNEEAAKSLSLKLDSSAPAITISVPEMNGRISDSADLTPVIAVYDDLSGADAGRTVVTLDGSPAKQGESIPVYSLPLGTHALTVTAADNAGNVRTVTVTFTTFASIDGMKALVDRFAQSGDISNAGIANSLKDKLNNGAIRSLINEVQAQSGKHISASAAEILLRDASALSNP